MPALALSRLNARIAESGPDGDDPEAGAWQRLEALPDPRSPRGLAGALLQRAHQRGIRAAFVTGDEVYGGRDLRRAIRAAVHCDSHTDPEIGLIPITIPELVRLLRDTVIPPPCRD